MSAPSRPATFDLLVEGTVFTTPSRLVTEADVQSMVDLGGYTHPLFSDPAHAAASEFGGRLLPGQGVLLLMGGLVEQSARFDDSVIALVGFDDVRFHSPVQPGDEVEVEVAVLARERRRGHRGLLTMRWTCRPAGPGAPAERAHAELVARMLLRVGDGPAESREP